MLAPQVLRPDIGTSEEGNAMTSVAISTDGAEGQRRKAIIAGTIGNVLE